jgi:hypothetical protein
MTKKTNIPINIVGGNTFGRYPKTSLASTYNMLISNDWLIPSAGYEIVSELFGDGIGRGLFNSINLNKLVAVINDKVFLIDDKFIATQIGTLDTITGDVFIDENNACQIAICDKVHIHIYDYNPSTPPAKFVKADLNFVPLYVSFQDGYFISVEQDRPIWRLSAPNNGLSWPAASNNEGGFQTKPDKPVACIRVPGKGNNLFVMGHTVTELWTDVGYKLFPYQRTSAFNIDYGCINSSTIAFSEQFVVWLGTNEKTGPIIVLSSGGETKTISNEGINYLISNLSHPEKSYGYLVNQDGHMLYYLTFVDPLDNLTLFYDFNTNSFFYATNYEMDFFPPRRVVFYNDGYYFVSFEDGNLYKLDSTIYTYDYYHPLTREIEKKEIPMVRITDTVRLPDNSPFIANNLTFTLEQGDSDEEQRIDLTLSRDGGNTFGSSLGANFNPIGKRANKVNFYQLGYANELTPQLRFWGKDRFLVSGGLLSIYQ